MAMTDRATVAERLECYRLKDQEWREHCTNTTCPYNNNDPHYGYWCCSNRLLHDAVTLLKAQEPRVMTPEEVMSTGPEDVCGIVEIIEEEHMYGCYMRRYDEGHVELLCDVPNLTERLRKGCARIWTARPTDDQRKAAKWDD